MHVLLKDIVPGSAYVYLDGWVVSTAAGRVQLEGWNSRHDLPWVPHVAALTDPGVRASVLDNREYWTSRAMPRWSSVQPNKRMQLTKLRAAPVRQAEVPPCAPPARRTGAPLRS